MTERGLYRRGKTWWVRYADTTGRVRRESSGTSDFRAAKKMLVDKRKQVSDGKDPVPVRVGKCTFADLSVEYRKWAANQRGWSRKVYFVAALENEFGPVLLSRISVLAIDSYLSRMLTDGRSNSTRNRHLATLAHMYTKALEWNLCTLGDCDRVHSVKMLPETSRLRFLTVDDCRRLVEACPDHLRPIVICALATGMRREEILGLTWAQVDLTHGFVLLARSKNEDPRQIPISLPLRAILEQTQAAERTGYVFRNAEGHRYMDVKRSFGTACKKVGISDFRFHDLRHTAASHMVMAGVDLPTVQSILGHRSYKMTLRYSHLAPGHRRAAVETLGRVLPLPSCTAQSTAQTAVETKKSLGPKPQALGSLGGADRDRTDSLLNTTRNTAPEDLKFPHDIEHPDDATGD